MAKESGWARWTARRREDAAIQEEKDFLDSIPDYAYGLETWGGDVKGKAPAGEGAIYQARRWLNKTQTTLEINISELEAKIRNYRGQASERLTITKARARLQSLKEAQAMATSVVSNSFSSWIDKMAAVKLVMSYAEYQYME